MAEHLIVCLFALGGCIVGIAAGYFVVGAELDQAREERDQAVSLLARLESVRIGGDATSRWRRLEDLARDVRLWLLEHCEELPDARLVPSSPTANPINARER